MMHKGNKGPYSMLRRFDRMALGLFLLIAFGLFLAINLEMRRLAQLEAKESGEVILASVVNAHQSLIQRETPNASLALMKDLLAGFEKGLAENGGGDLALRVLDGTDPAHTPDAVQRALIEQLVKDPQSRGGASLRRIDGEHLYAIMHRGPMIDGKPTLLTLHTPLATLHQQANQDSLRLMLLILSALGLLYMLQRVMVGKYLAAPLHYLRTLAYRICHAEELPAEPFSKPREIELGEAIDAFNKLAGKEKLQE